jgi:shikimate kinase
MKLVLIGLRGSGKSTVGALLAKRLHWAFVDTDEVVQQRAGLTIRQLFEQKGEAAFRTLEAAAVAECANMDRTVVAPGGGAVLDPASARALKHNGFVVHLSAEPVELWHRISHDKASTETRPPLGSGNESGLAELKRLMLARAAIYAQLRDVEVDVGGRSPIEVVDAVLLLMRTHGVIKENV